MASASWCNFHHWLQKGSLLITAYLNLRCGIGKQHGITIIAGTRVLASHCHTQHGLKEKRLSNNNCSLDFDM